MPSEDNYVNVAFHLAVSISICFSILLYNFNSKWFLTFLGEGISYVLSHWSCSVGPRIPLYRIIHGRANQPVRIRDQLQDEWSMVLRV